MKKRPTETLTGIALGVAAFGFCTQVGFSQLVSGLVAVFLAFGPLAVSQFVDALHR